YGRTQTLAGTGLTGGATPTHDLAPNTAPTSGMASYTLVGNAACAAASPTPTPTPTPASTPTPTPTPTGGNTLTDAGGPLTFTGGPYLVPNPSSQATGKPTCNAALPCDEYTFKVNVGDATAKTKYVR